MRLFPDWEGAEKDISFFTIPIALYPKGGILVSVKYMLEAEKAKVIRRLRILSGQIRGLQTMVANDTYCIDVITQTSAVKQGLSNIEDLLLENHLKRCVRNQMTSGQTGKAIGEILTVYKLKRK
jgi:CsoR family transcriptional regulator, copper-sensing transcriptional repressor